MHTNTPKRRRIQKPTHIIHYIELFAIGIVALVLFIAAGVIIWASLVPIPAIDNFQSREVAQSTKIYDRTGSTVLYDVHGTVRRTSVALSAISPYIEEATISIEDAEFYKHHGVRFTAFLRAIWVDITTGSFKEGGSTITQQVVKNAILTQHKTIARKVEEIILALRLEKAYTKDQILNTYLNESPYGGTIYGIQEASQYFFGVDAKDVDLAQAAYLSALPQSPTHLSPYGDHRTELDSRKNLVLQKMKSNGYITQDAYNQASGEVVQFRNERDEGIKAPHFVFYIRDYLESKYGVDTVDKGGLKVITTLDYDLQQKAEEIVKRNALKNTKQFNASNAALVAIDPKTGQILTMVGSRGYFDPLIDGKVNVATSNRQPGSSFKPFVYATALQKGYTPNTMVFDLQTQFSTACSPQDVTNDTPPCYSPVNYDGTFSGPMSLRNAIAQSKNIPSVKILYLAGIKDSIATAVSMGISTLSNAAHYGLTLVLGGGEVNLLEMTGAYGVFANDGIKNPPTGILEVTDSNGNVLEKYTDQSSRVLDPQIARMMNDILSDNVARTPEFGADSPLYFSNYTVADKTGTTNDFKDTWILGYTPSLVVGSWAGNNDNTPMQKKIAAFIVAPMWHEFMNSALAKYSSASDVFPTPAPLDTQSLPLVLNGSWNTDPSKGIHDILYWISKDSPQSAAGLNSRSDSQFQYWDYPVSIWASQHGTVNPTSNGEGAVATNPSETIGHPFSITSPQSGTSISANTILHISSSGPNPIAHVTYYLNGVLLGIANNTPFIISVLPQSRGPSILKAVAELTNGGTEESSIGFTIQ